MRSQDNTLTTDEEQTLSDHEQRFAEIDHRISDVLYRTCAGWSETEFLLLAREALELVDGIPDDAFDAIESAARWARERELPEHLRNL